MATVREAELMWVRRCSVYRLRQTLLSIRRGCACCDTDSHQDILKRLNSIYHRKKVFCSFADCASASHPGVHYFLHRRLEIRDVARDENKPVSFRGGGNKPVHCAYGSPSCFAACYNSTPGLRDCAID